jgi:hypothetical protein
MIALGLRLTVSGGREAIARLAILATAVALGVGLLLTAVAGINAVNAVNDRSASSWFRSSLPGRGPATAGVAPLWWQPSGDTFNGQQIDRYDVAATGPTSLVLPGIPHDPDPGQYYASPALAALLRSTPADELSDRYPGHLIGTIGDAGLSYPNSLVIIIGRSPAQLAGRPNTMTIPHRTEGEGLLVLPDGAGGDSASMIDLILSVVALALLTPVLIFIATATRLSAARREQRFAALRLSGATRRQVSLLAAVESTVAALLGVAMGFGLFFLLRDPLAAIPFTGHPFFPSDLSLSVPDILVVAIGVPAAAVVSARLALRRVHVSPLGVSRRAAPRPPRAWHALPLLAGAAELGFFVVHGRPASVPGQIQAFVPGFLLIIIGLITAGPWLTMVMAGIMARRTSRPSALIAARRLADDPRTAFRAVSGLVLALFITTVAVAGITTQNAEKFAPAGGAAASGVLADSLGIQVPGPPGQFPVVEPVTTPSATLLAQLREIDGVGGLVEVRADGGLTIPGKLLDSGSASASSTTAPIAAGVVSCAQLATTPVLGRCPAGATTAAFPQDLTSGFAGIDLAAITWPAANIAVQQLGSRKLYAINVATDGSVSAVERARTLLANPDAPSPYGGGPQTLGEVGTQANSASNGYQQLADVIILVGLPIAGCTLAAGIAGGLADRRRPFSMLRLTGARLATLRRVVALESAVPLLAVAAVAIGAGFGATAMYASVMLHHSLVAPGIAYYLITAGGIVVSLGIIAATFPLLTRITGPEAARNE